MDDDDNLMITGAKKTKNLKNEDKNDINLCINNFKKFAFFKNEEMINKETFTNFCLNGEVDKNYIRPLIWKVFLNVLSINNRIEDWVSQVAKQRTDYKVKLKNMNALKKFSGDPLGGSNDDNELKKIINLDVNRTYQDKDLFQNTTIKEMMVNILFIWSKENKDVSYKQGMNEILAVILFGLYPFYFKSSSRIICENVLSYLKSDRETYAKQIYNYFHDEDELACDLFFLFDSVMNKGIKDLFDNTLNKRDIKNFKKYELFQQQWTDEDESLNQLPLQKRCSLIIKEKLKIIDEELYNHFIKIDLNCAIFLQRWLKCIFNREFHPRDVIVLWDAIIAHDLNDSITLANESYNFMFIDFIAVAMVNYIREDCKKLFNNLIYLIVLRKDQNDCFQRLFKYPPIETPVILITLASQVKELLYNKKRKRDQKLSNKLTNDKNEAKKPTSITSFLKTNSNGNLGKKSGNSSSEDKPALKNGTTATNNSTTVQSPNTNTTNPLPTSSSPETRLKKNESVKSETIASNNEEVNGEIVRRLEMIFTKYKHIYEVDDLADFETILENLKSNLEE